MLSRRNNIRMMMYKKPNYTWNNGIVWIISLTIVNFLVQLQFVDMKLGHTSRTFINFVPHLSPDIKPNNRCTFRAPSFNSPSLLLRFCRASPSAHLILKSIHRFINHLNSSHVAARILLSKVKMSSEACKKESITVRCILELTIQTDYLL